MQADKTSTARILKSFTRKESAEADLEKVLANGGSIEDLLCHIATQPDFSRRFPGASRALNEQKASSSGIALKAPDQDGLRFAKSQIIRGLRTELYESQKQWAVNALRSSALEKEILALKNTLAALEAKITRQNGESVIPLSDEDSAREKAEPASSCMVNLHRLDTSNAGDLACAPADYFPQDFGSKLEITGCDQRLYPDLSPLAKWFQEISGKVLVVGGGGLLDQGFFAWSIEKIGSLDNKKVLWGAGHNDYSITNWSPKPGGYKSKVDGFHLIGIRDWGMPYEWVPCVSCMSPLFDKTYEKKHAVAAYLHTRSKLCPKEIEDALNLPENTPILYNDAGFERAVEFLGSAELIVTNSYHGIYWATLLGRKVVGIPISSKFFGLKHPAPLCNYEDWRRFSRLAATYPEALSECREANLKFREKVLDFALS